jgi:hypothetical protein
MPIEEITLSVPANPQSDHGDTPTGPGAVSEEVESVNEFSDDYVKSARARDRLAFTNQGRMRNRERFNQSLKAIVKKVATHASGPVADRSARMEVRAGIYKEVMQLTNAMSRDQLQTMRRAQTRFRWSLGLAILGLLGIGATIVTHQVTALGPLWQ